MLCALAFARLAPSIRWDAERIGVVGVTPFNFKTPTQDVVEEEPGPHYHTKPKPGDGNIQVSKRLNMFESDLKDFGYTE